MSNIGLPVAFLVGFCGLVEIASEIIRLPFFGFTAETAEIANLAAILPEPVERLKVLDSLVRLGLAIIAQSNACLSYA
jgi:hypothetical protein